MTAWSAVLGGSISLEFMLADTTLDDVLHDLVIVKGGRTGVPRVMGVDHNAPRILSGSMHIEGASKNDATAQVAAINALTFAGTTLALHSTDATYPVTLKVLPSAPMAARLNDAAWDLSHKALVPFTWTCEPYAYGPETIVYQGVVSPPCLLDFNVPGDYPTPLQVVWTPSNRAGYIDNFAMGLLPDQTTGFSTLFRDSPWGTVDIVAGNPAVCGTAGPHGLFTGQFIRIFGTATTPSTISNFQVTVLDSTHFSIPLNVTTGGSGYWSPWFDLVSGLYDVAGASDSDAYGGVAMQHAVDDWVTWLVNDTALPRGTYLPFVRIGKTTSGANPFVRLSQTGGDALQAELTGAGVGYATRRWPQTVAAPAMRVSGGSVSFFHVGMRAGSGGGAARFDWLAMLPISWGYLLQLAAAPWSASTFILDYDGTTYLGGVAQTSGISTSGMNVLGAQSLLFLMGAYEQQPTFDGTLEIRVIPRYALWR